MKKLALRLVIACCLSIILPTACVRQHAAQSAELVALHQGSLKLPDKPDAPKMIYVDANANPALAQSLVKDLGTLLAKSKFRIASSPSKAGYILHVKVLREGAVAPDILKATVDSGYGGPDRFSGQGAKAMLVDALMVQRRVPSAKRPSRQRLKNISSRNALGSSQIRLAVMYPGSAPKNTDFIMAIAKELAESLK